MIEKEQRVGTDYLGGRKIKYFLLIVMMFVVTGSVKNVNLANENEGKEENTFLLEQEIDFLNSPSLISNKQETWTLIWNDDFKNDLIKYHKSLIISI